MQHPFNVLAPEYTSLLAAMKINTSRASQLSSRADAILGLASHHADEWAEVFATTAVPKLWGLASFERESGSDYACSPAQGDRWDRRSIHVPSGLGPYPNWGASCVAAYRIDHLDLIGEKGWTWDRACYDGELFNGFGPRNHGRHTGYLWAWSNIYTGGKYVSDGVWSPTTFDQQCGMAPLMMEMLRLDPSLALADGWPDAADPAIAVPPPQPVPDGVGGGAEDAEWIQMQLNKFGASPPLTVDGNYGRVTRRAVAAFQGQHHLTVDGIAGPQTIAKMKGLA